MRIKRTWMPGIVAGLALVAALAAQAAQRPVRLSNRLRVEYDDNIRQTETDRDTSWKLIEELRLSLDLDLPKTVLSARYRPSLVLWENRPEDPRDLHHAFDLVLNHAFTPRFSIALNDTLRYNELPELIDRGTTVRQEYTYLYNTASGVISWGVLPSTRVDLTGRSVLLRYDREEVAQRHDYDLLVGGLDIRHDLTGSMSLSGQARYEVLGYPEYEERFDRGSTSVQGGARMEYIISRALLGSASGGISYRDYQDAYKGSDTAPYGEASLTYMITPAIRLTGGASYSLLETDIFPYSSQRRAHGYLSLAWDLTSRLSWYVSASAMRGMYDSETLPEGALIGDLPASERRRLDVPEALHGLPLSQEYIDSLEDKQEDSYRISTRLSYRIHRNHSLEAGWQYSMLDSELRPDYDRNRLHFGWRARLF